jgi:F-type H+-transporting ATPase subunit epsilon
MADMLKFELVSPEQLLLSREVDMVVAPGAEGDFGISAQHAPLVAALRPGLVNIYENGRLSERIFVSGGFAEVSANSCTILADAAWPYQQLDAAIIEGELRDAQDDVADAKSDFERRLAEQRRLIAEAKRTALSHPVYS